MSFRDIGVITKKVKAEVERESGQTKEEIDNIGSMPKESQAFKLFSEGKTPIEVVIALDLPADIEQYTEGFGNSKGCIN